MQNIIDRILGPTEPLTRLERERSIMPLCPTGQQLREWGRNFREMQAAALADEYGMPEGSTMEEVLAEHHRRRCVKLDIPVETSNHARLLLELGYPRDTVLERDRKGSFPADTKFDS